MIEKNLTLSLDESAFPARLRVSQFDTMWQFVFSITYRSQTWEIPGGATAILNGRKPDGNVFAFSGTIAGNKVSVDCDVQMTAVPGPVVCELSILSDGKVVGTANFVMDVERAPKSPDDVTSETTLPAYAELLETAAEIPADLPGYITTWLAEHISSPSNPPIDTSLTVAGAAADARKTGQEVSGLKHAMDQYNLVPYFSDPAGKKKGVSCTVNSDGSFTFVGTATGAAYFNFFHRDIDEHIPDVLKPGETYRIVTNLKGTGVFYRLFFYDSSGSSIPGGFRGTSGYTVTVPDNVDKATLRFEVSAGTTVNCTVQFQFLKSRSNDDLQRFTAKLQSDLRTVITNVSNEEYASVSVSNNSVRISDASDAYVKRISVAWKTASDTLLLAGKNVYQVTDATKNSSNVTFVSSATTGTVRVQSTGATADVPEQTYVDKKSGSASCHFTFSVPADTWVTFNGNPSEELSPKSKVFYQIYKDGVLLARDKDQGYTFYATAGAVYGFRIIVTSGWAGDIMFRPQLELGTVRTAFEPFNGKVFSPADDVRDYSYDFPYATDWEFSEYLSCRFDDNKTIEIISVPQESAAPLFSPAYSGSIPNIMRFTPEVDTVVSFGSVYEGTMAGGGINFQITDGSTIYNCPIGEFREISVSAGVEYFVRFIVLANTSADVYVYPCIYMGVHTFKTQTSGSTIIARGCSVDVTYQKIKTSEMAKAGEQALKRLPSYLVKDGFLAHLTSRPMLSFIDDDTTSCDLVRLYHDVFDGTGVVGSYAVMTRRMTDLPTSQGGVRRDGEGELEALLKQYEMEGFGMLFHCYWQNDTADRTRYFDLSERDISKCRQNLLRGLREYQSMGFQHSHLWVTPYGVSDREIRDLAQELGFECMISMSDCTFVSEDYLSRWHIPRMSISDGYNRDVLRMSLQACAEKGGWMTIVTHVNEWTADNRDTLAQEVRDTITYARGLGIEVVPFAQAYERWKPVLYLAETM